MNIIPQMKLFEESDFENLGDLERLQMVLGALDDGALIRKLYRIRGKGRNDQEEHLKVFLTDDEVPIDDFASERALRNFTIGRKNWVTIKTIRGAQASAAIYSVTGTARDNGLNVYYYIRHLLTELIKLKDADGNIGQAKLELLMPWSKELPAECHSKRRQ